MLMKDACMCGVPHLHLLAIPRSIDCFVLILHSAALGMQVQSFVSRSTSPLLDVVEQQQQQQGCIGRESKSGAYAKEAKTLKARRAANAR